MLVCVCQAASPRVDRQTNRETDKRFSRVSLCLLWISYFPSVEPLKRGGGPPGVPKAPDDSPRRMFEVCVSSFLNPHV